MALIDKLTAIADGFRSSRGTTDSYTLDQMAELALEKVCEDDLLLPTDTPEYVTPELIDVYNKVKSAQTDDSITFIALSDSHYPADQDLSYCEETKKSSIQANMAIKILSYMISPDFIAHTGDVGGGDKTTTPDVLKTQIEGFNSYFKESCGNIPCFLAIGNHDTGIYYHDVQTDGSIYTLDGDYLYNNFTKYSEDENTVISGQEYGGYCYRDFENKKLRVFMLNTSEQLICSQSDKATFGSQRLWLANAIIDLNSKTDSSEWKFIILCHYPADYGNTMPLSQLLKAYVEGESVDIDIEDGSSYTVSFSDNNVSKFIAQFHGHVHNFIYDKLSFSEYPDYVSTKYGACRICIPNGEYNPNRHNYYDTVGNYTDISFAESESYTKTVDTSDGTSFVVNVINPSEQKIYSFCYGAGIDRTIDYSDTEYYSIVTSLENITFSGNTSEIGHGSSYTATLTVPENYVETVTITMGGVDITDEAYSDGIISISEVTGNIVITATANIYNWIPFAMAEAGGDTVYGTSGYQTNMRLSTSNGITENAMDGMCLTGFIPIKHLDTIRIKNVTLPNTSTNSTSYTYVFMYKDSGEYTSSINYETLNSSLVDGVITFKLQNSVASYIRLACGKIDESSVLTINQEIID